MQTIHRQAQRNPAAGRPKGDSTFWLLALLVFVVVPLVSLLFVTSGPESPLYTSISRLGWVTGRRAFMFVWGLVTFSTLGRTLWLATEYAGISRHARAGVRSLMLASCAILFVGACVPANDGLSAELSLPAVIHNELTLLGFLGIGAGLLTCCVALFTARQGAVAVKTAVIMGLILLSSVLCLLFLKDPASYCGASALTQIYVFNVINFFLFWIYGSNRLRLAGPPAAAADKGTALDRAPGTR